ncbi:MAG: hypothetical protein LKCHEGNO_02899 [Burkholderiaceae bacterium]|nr:hypothetical protein [Burkholderiaceae bacterium]
MAGVGQQALVRAHQRLDAPGGAVETARHRGHLVAAGLVDALAERAGAEALDAALQPFEPPRQAAHHRVGAGGQRDEQQRQQHEQAHARWPLRRQPRPVADPMQRGARFGCALPGIAVAPREPAHARTHHPQRAAVVESHRHAAAAAVRFTALVAVGRGDALAVDAVERHRQAQPQRPLAQCRGLLVGRRIGRRQRALHQLGPGIQALGGHAFDALALALEVLLHEPARHQRKRAEHAHHREPDAQVERTHRPCPAAPPGWRVRRASAGIRPRRPACARTRSRRRAR